MVQFKRTGGPAVAEKNSASNLYHIEQVNHNEGVAFFKINGGMRQYKITGKPGASQRAVTDAFRKFNAEASIEGSSAGSLYWKHFRGNKLLNITPVKDYVEKKN